MDLVLSENSAANTVFKRSTDEQPLYEVKTGSLHKIVYNRTSTIYKLHSGSSSDSVEGRAEGTAAEAQSTEEAGEQAGKEEIGTVKMSLMSPVMEGTAIFRGSDMTPRRKALLKRVFSYSHWFYEGG
jgi:hypothetical protein